MSHTHQTHRIFYALTAILLLMQSFAIWHDAEHGFHTNTDQCERFETFNHVPTLDIVTLPTAFFTVGFSVKEEFLPHPLLIKKQREAYSIRAPPSFS
jgi:hypothetical protein